MALHVGYHTVEGALCEYVVCDDTTIALRTMAGFMNVEWDNAYHDMGGESDKYFTGPYEALNYSPLPYVFKVMDKVYWIVPCE